MIKFLGFFILAIASLASIVSTSAAQQKPCNDPCGVPTAWQEFNSFTSKTNTPDQPGYTQLQGRFDKETNDIQVDVEDSGPGPVATGKILMIAGRVMAIQGPIAKPGYEIDAIDAAVLQWQLVIKVLGRAFPDGPASVKPAQPVDYSDSETGIKIATESAGGMLQAPWRVVGELKHVEPDAVQFDLTLTSSNTRDPAKKNTVTFSGRLFNSPNPKIDDQLSLGKWSLFAVGPQSRKQGNSTIIDYSAAPETTAYKTVADVRKKLEADKYPGERDSAKDFTGFWKTNCEDAFGLQIKHFGTDGKYSILFCGPGGCGDPANEGAKTFITKDPHYEVISEDELREKTGDGWETYRRCTRDTHPVLKYKEEN